MIYIRADGNTAIGMGHVMRCLAVAEAVTKLNCPPLVFLAADEGCRELIEDRGFCVFSLETDYREMLGEMPQLERVLDRRSDLVFVDSYYASDEYYLALGKLARVACFEDLGVPHPVDLLINYNLYAPQLEQRYRASLNEQNQQNLYPKNVLLGTSYMPLRRAFQKPSGYQLRDRVTQILITTGGSDPYFAAGAITDALIKDTMILEKGIHLHLVSGPYNQYAQELQSRYGSTAQITIHEKVKNLRSLLLESDIVISAAGSTVYEASSIGVPMVVFYFAENQRQGAEALAACTEITNAGCFAEEGSAVADRIREAVRRCISDSAYRERLCQQETALIDGRGAHRIAEQIEALCRRS